MKSRWIAASMVSVGVWFVTMASVQSQSNVRDDMKQSDQVTVITSDKLTFDYRQNFALFEEDVLVVDPEMKMVCDKLVVWFDEDGEAKTIKAEGHVKMTQEDKVIESGEAVYDLELHRIVLTKSPRVQQGLNYMEGTVITYYVDTDVMVCEPQAKVALFPASDKKRDLIFSR